MFAESDERVALDRRHPHEHQALTLFRSHFNFAGGCDPLHRPRKPFLIHLLGSDGGELGYCQHHRRFKSYPQVSACIFIYPSVDEVQQGLIVSAEKADREQLGVLRGQLAAFVLLLFSLELALLVPVRGAPILLYYAGYIDLNSLGMAAPVSGILSNIILPPAMGPLQTGAIPDETVAYWVGLGGGGWWLQSGYCLEYCPDNLFHSQPQLYLEWMDRYGGYQYVPLGTVSFDSTHSFQLTLEQPVGSCAYGTFTVDGTLYSYKPVTCSNLAEASASLETHQDIPPWVFAGWSSLKVRLSDMATWVQWTSCEFSVVCFYPQGFFANGLMVSPFDPKNGAFNAFYLGGGGGCGMFCAHY